MPIGGYQVRAPGSLKEAETLLVYMCGGLDTAVSILDGRVKRTQLSRYTNAGEEHANTHMPVDIVIRLEAACGAPVVTQYLAFEARSLLVPLPGGPDTPYLEHLGKIGEETGEFFRTATGALADGVMSLREAGAVKATVMRLATALGVLLGRLDHVIESGKEDR